MDAHQRWLTRDSAVLDSDGFFATASLDTENFESPEAGGQFGASHHAGPSVAVSRSHVKLRIIASVWRVLRFEAEDTELQRA